MAPPSPLYVLSPLTIVSIDDRGALILVKLCLMMVPKLLPRRAAAILRRKARLEINGAHVHHLEGVLLLERDIRHQAGMHDDQLAQMRHLAHAQDDGALLQPGNLLVGELLCQLAHLEVAVREGGFVHGVGGAVGRLVRAREAGVVRLLGLGDGEEDAVFVIAADARGAELLCVGDDAGRVGTWKDISLEP